MRIIGREFSPPWWATLATSAGVALTIALGFWQLGRAQTKLALQQRIAEFAKGQPLRVGAEALNVDELLLRKVEVRGQFEPRHAVFIDNRIYKHHPGYFVMMPLRVAGGDTHVVVNRGWVAAGSARGRAPQVATPQGGVVVIGTATPFSERYLELSSKVAEGNIWQNMVLERYRQATHLKLQPIIVQQTEAIAGMDDGLIRDWPPVDLKRNTHLAYAVQWFALAGAIFIAYVVVNVRRQSGSTSA